MDRKRLFWVLGGLLVLLAAGLGYSLTRGWRAETQASKVEVAEKQEEKLEDTCASPATYARLKEVAFEEAVRVRNADPANLDTLAAHSVVRMEHPVVKSRDEQLNVTVCAGRFILELPPGAERGFGGERRLAADIEYAAQEAADGSGLVYQVQGAEPIVYKLAAFDLRGGGYQPPAAEPGSAIASAAPLPPAMPAAEPEPAPAYVPPAPARPTQPKAVETRRPTREPTREPAARREPPPPAETRVASSARPSFNCRHARTSSEKMVCGSGQLAARDRAMSSQFYSALSNADPGTRARLRRTRDRFLAYRDRCRDEGCVAQAYEGRMAEIRDIVAEGE